MSDERLLGLISAPELHSELLQDNAPVLIDSRFNSTAGDHAARYEAGHIPGAVFADTLTDLSSLPAAGEGLRPPPRRESLQASIRRWGISRESRVVIYDTSFGLSAGRAWWLLRWAGVRDVRLLDGGLSAWIRAGFGISSKMPPVAPGDFVVTGGGLPQTKISEISTVAAEGLLIDVRSADEFAGRKALPGIPAAGHIPDATNLPMQEGLTFTGLHKTAIELRQRYADIGADGSRPITIYCGAGGGAAHEVFVLDGLGITASLFNGGWSAWSSWSGPTK